MNKKWPKKPCIATLKRWGKKSLGPSLYPDLHQKVYSGPRPFLHTGFMEICSGVFVWSCWQTNQPTNTQMDTDENTTSLVEVIKTPLLNSTPSRVLLVIQTYLVVYLILWWLKFTDSMSVHVLVLCWCAAARQHFRIYHCLIIGTWCLFCKDYTDSLCSIWSSHYAEWLLSESCYYIIE